MNGHCSFLLTFLLNFLRGFTRFAPKTFSLPENSLPQPLRSAAIRHILSRQRFATGARSKCPGCSSLSPLQLMVKVATFEALALGAGFATVTLALPLAAIAVLGIAACNSVSLTNTVASAAPFH